MALALAVHARCAYPKRHSRQTHGRMPSAVATDDRVAFADKRIGRLNGNCTAWLVSNGAVLTAGHCVDFDPDNSGPLLPDGVADITNATLVEFDVPQSSAAGVISPSAVANQFPVDMTYLRWRFDGEGQGLVKTGPYLA